MKKLNFWNTIFWNVLVYLLVTGLLIWIFYLGYLDAFFPVEENPKHYEYISSILLALFAAVAFASTETFVSNKTGLKKSVSSAAVFFSLAMVLWAIIGSIRLLNLDYTWFDDKGIDQLRSWFSTANSLLLLLGFSHLELKKNKFYLDYPWRYIQRRNENDSIYSSGQPYTIVYFVLSVIALLVMRIDSKIPFVADLYFTFVTTLILVFGMGLAYWQRGVKIFSFLSFIAGVTIVIAHLRIGFSEELRSIFTHIFKFYIVLLLFALQVTTFEKKKREELHEKEGQLKGARKELEKNQGQLQDTKHILKDFVEVVVKAVDISSARKTFDFVYRKLLSNKMYDYGFAIGIECKDKIIFPYRYEEYEFISTAVEVLKNEKPFALKCMNSEGNILIEENLESRKNRNMTLFPGAKSLIFIKLEKDNKVFGVMTVQSKKNKLKLKSEQLSVLESLAFLISNVVTASDAIDPIEKFLSTISSLRDHDMHDDDKLEPQYQAFRTFLGWSQTSFEECFPSNEYQKPADQLLNEALKDMNKCQLTVRLIVLILVAAFEEMKKEEVTNFELQRLENPFITLFQSMEVKQAKNYGKINHYAASLAAKLRVPEENFKTVVKLLYTTLKKVFRNKNRYGSMSTILKKQILFDHEEKKFSLSLKLVDPDKLEQHMIENRKKFKAGGEGKLLHDTSRGFFLLGYFSKYTIEVHNNNPETILEFTFN